MVMSSVAFLYTVRAFKNRYPNVDVGENRVDNDHFTEIFLKQEGHVCVTMRAFSRSVPPVEISRTERTVYVAQVLGSRTNDNDVEGLYADVINFSTHLFYR
jgi:hypothetical protein